MMLIKGFLFVIGCITGLAVCVFLLIMFLKLTKKPKHASVKIWREYLAAVLSKEDFTEATFITNLIKDKNDDEIIITPTGYNVNVGRDITIDENGNDGVSKIKVNKTFKIIKNK